MTTLVNIRQTKLLILKAKKHGTPVPMVHHARGNHRSEKDSRSSLRLFLLYRIGVSALLVSLFFVSEDHSLLGRTSPPLFQAAALMLLACNIFLLFPTFRGIGNFRYLVYTMVGLDLLALTAMLHASGGLESGIGLLMITTVAGASLLIPGRKAPFFAASATLLILLEQVYSLLEGKNHGVNLGFAAIHGILLFAIALLSAGLARRAQTSEKLASQRAEDLAGLAALNEKIVDRLESGTVVIGDDGRVRLVNQAALNLLNQSGLKYTTELHELSPELAAAWSQWKQAPSSRTHSLKNTTSGNDFEARFTHIGSGRQIATLAFLEDITERGKLLQDIKLASLGRLTASIAHEIRNPLGAISHAGQLLSESSTLDQSDRRLVEIIEKQSRRMNRLIADILSLSKRRNDNAARVELHTWLPEIIEDFTQQNDDASDVDITLEVEPCAAMVDTNLLHQVLWNLLSNALKYAEPGDRNTALKLTISLSPSIDHKFAQIDVLDNGEALEEHTANHLFEPFFTTSAEGTGLGLYLSRELCQSSGGALTYLKTEEGRNCFRIRLPLASYGQGIAA